MWARVTFYVGRHSADVEQPKAVRKPSPLRGSVIPMQRVVGAVRVRFEAGEWEIVASCVDRQVTVRKCARNPKDVSVCIQRVVQ